MENRPNLNWLVWVEEYKKTKYHGTLEKTHKLFESGLDISEIAIKRGFRVESVERQIIALIVKGLIGVDKVVDKEKMEKIIEVAKKSDKLSKIKEELGEGYSYFEIKASLASLVIEPN